ncbi:hypothetical protein COY87_00975, partial [Candidatus Roizmanbacteria bacterium CG_4_10_14_0_8_um_filter_33_9]
MTSYRQLSLRERELLFGALKQGKSLRSIGKDLGRSHTTLVRELKRNCKYGRAYLPCKAQTRYENITKKQRHKAPLKNPEIYLFVRDKLREKWSPETVSGRLKFESKGTLSISKDTIYSYVYKTKKRRRDFVKYLVRKHKRRRKLISKSTKKLGRIKDAVSIDKRHYLINTRTTLGHWEGDLMEGKRYEPKALSAEVERLTRYTKLILVKNKTSSQKTKGLKSSLISFPKRLKKSLTIDNGPENHQALIWTQTLGVKVYNCNAYHSWEKGTVENTIGRVRRYIPKGTSLLSITDRFFIKVSEILTMPPRPIALS